MPLWLWVGGGCGEKLVSELGMDRYTLRYLKCITNKDLLQHMDLWSMLCGSLDGKGVWGRTDTCMCTAEPLCCPPGTVPVLFISCGGGGGGLVAQLFLTLVTPGTVACQAPVCGISLPRNQTCISCLAGGSFTTEPPGKLYPNTK